jgi:hypothetical protein
VVYSEQFQCPRCGEIVTLFDCPEAQVPYEVGNKKKQKTELKKRRVCPHCLDKYREPDKDFVISTRTKKFGSVPVMISYLCEGECKPQRELRHHNEPGNTKKAKCWLDHDMAKLAMIEKVKIPHWVPDRKMMDVVDDSQPWGTEWRPGRNFRTVAGLYTKRNFWALGAALAASRDKFDRIPHLKLAIASVTLGLSRMNRYVPNHYSFQNRILAGTYYVPMLGVAINPFDSWNKKVVVVKKAVEALSKMGSHSKVNVAAAGCVEYLRGVSPSSLDFIFTDPPYVGKIQYGELNFVWESWLGFEGSWLDNEIIVNPFRKKSLDDWDQDLRKALLNCFTALKPARWMSLCYHDTDAETWARIQNAILDIGFEIHTVTVLDPKQKSSNQLLAEKVVKSDLVINCRKPRPGESRESGSDETALVSHRVRDILLDTLATSGGQTRDKLWDIVLKRLLTRGQMAQHRFDDILSEVAFKTETGRWFIKEKYESLSDSDIHNEEIAGAALTAFARLRTMGVPVNFAASIALEKQALAEKDADETKIERHIRSTLADSGHDGEKFRLGGRMKGCEFYDCLFFYLTRYLKGRPSGKTPRRNLADFLEEYLVRFRDGDKWLYRPPTDTEMLALKKSRQSGLGRRIRQFSSFLRGEGEFPQEKIPDIKTQLAWLKHCASFGLADEGAMLYEKGGIMGRLAELGEDDRYDAEDYYSQCKRAVKKEDPDDEDVVGDEESD